MTNKAILIFLFLLLPFQSTGFAKDVKIERVFLQIAYMEALDWCKKKHPESYSTFSDEFARWHLKNEEDIENAWKQLVKEAQEDPVKAKKLGVLHEYVGKQINGTFLKMSHSLSLQMCSQEGTFLEMFDSEHITKH